MDDAKRSQTLIQLDIALLLLIGGTADLDMKPICLLSW
jgi:hypothetical protein